MVYAGATIKYWFLAVEAACFVDRLTAHWYSDIEAYSTPYCRIYGQHYPDASVLKPWGCAALVLHQPDALSKFSIRTSKLIFVSYAPYHPTYTYGFLNPKTGRMIHSQDAIFLTNEFPFKDARARLGAPLVGDTIPARTLSRSPFAHLAPPHLRFDWNGGPTLPAYDDTTILTADDMDNTAPVPTVSFEPTVNYEPERPPTTISPPPSLLSASLKSHVMKLSTNDIDNLHDYIHGMEFIHPDDDLGKVTITGHGTYERSPVTFHNTTTLQEEFTSTWEVVQWLQEQQGAPSIDTMIKPSPEEHPPTCPRLPDAKDLTDRRPVRACRHRRGAHRCVPHSSDSDKPPPMRRKTPLVGMYATFDGHTVPPRTWQPPHISDITA